MTPPTTAELETALGRRIVSRSPWIYSSSYPIEELELAGEAVRVLFKNVSPQAMFEIARKTKPSQQRDPLREIGVYQQVLSQRGLSSPALLAAAVDASAGRYWLFLEKVAGLPLWQIGDFDVWLNVAGWLGDMHRRMMEHTGELPASLLRYDGAMATAALQRAGWHAPAGVDRLIDLLPTLVRTIDALPATFIHGEFYPSNILIADAAPRVRPVDWEMAGVGCGLIDLAAFIAGKWTAAQRSAIVSAYRQSHDCPGFDEALAACRLYQAVLCLGWSPSWSPPREHAIDWLATALELADQTGWTQ